MLFEELRRLDPERLREPMNHDECGVAFPSLNTTNIGPVNVREGCEFLLGDARRFTNSADDFPKGNAFATFLHEEDRMGCYLPVYRLEVA